MVGLVVSVFCLTSSKKYLFLYELKFQVFVITNVVSNRDTFFLSKQCYYGLDYRHCSLVFSSHGRISPPSMIRVNAVFQH